MAEWLGRNGYHVTTASDGWEALERHRSRPADVVITDLLMPGMGGDELIRRLRRSQPDLPIFVMTGHTTFDEARKIVAGGASAVLKKPVDLQNLSERLRHMVGR